MKTLFIVASRAPCAGGSALNGEKSGVSVSLSSGALEAGVLRGLASHAAHLAEGDAHSEGGPLYLSGERIEALCEQFTNANGVAFDAFGFARAVESAVHNLLKESQCK